MCIRDRLFVDIALTIAFTLAASLLVALSFVPMMAAGLLKNTKAVSYTHLLHPESYTWKYCL